MMDKVNIDLPENWLVKFRQKETLPGGLVRHNVTATCDTVTFEPNRKHLYPIQEVIADLTTLYRQGKLSEIEDNDFKAWLVDQFCKRGEAAHTVILMPEKKDHLLKSIRRLQQKVKGIDYI